MFSDFSAVIRWSLPGWVFALTLIFPHWLSMLVLVPTHSPWLTMLATSQGTSTLLTTFSGILLLVAVPVGFLIYQIYFWYYWISADKEDWGGWAQIPIQTAQGTSIAADVEKKVKDSTHEAWFLVEQRWYFLLATQGRDAMNLLSVRAGRLLDLYHALGAIFTALMVGSVFNVFSVNTWPVFFQWGVAVPYMIILSLLSWTILSNRSYTRKNLVQFQNAVMKSLEQNAAEQKGTSQQQVLYTSLR